MMDVADRLDTGDRIAEVPFGDEPFTDVSPDDVHVEGVSRLSQAGVVTGGPAGLAATQYGLDRPVTRAQMASFLARTTAT